MTDSKEKVFSTHKTDLHKNIQSSTKYTHSQMIQWWFFRKFGIDITQESVIFLMGITPKDSTLCYRNNHSTVFIESLFIISRNWK